ncbi:Eisosome component PIL1-domain-containing protein [Russula dissimulans]|nr:Eisosome component PIL1-domain-containing protein [Russula dissimulans]
MPVPGFLSSIADKAQTALNNSPISQHIPPSLSGAPRPGPSPPADSGSTYKSHTIEQIQHQFRQLQQSYSIGSTSPAQRIITLEKGITLDFQSLSLDSKSQSKELYLWGQHEASDVKDVSDRLAFLNYVSGALATTLSVKLDKARVPLKELRDNEVALTQRRNIRAGLEQQISRLENSRGYEKRIAELKAQLAKAENDDEALEKQHEIILRRALKESEHQKFQALREYGEKLSLVAQAAEAVTAELPSVPPSSDHPYTGVERTGPIRASLQHALDNWKPGQTTLSAPADAILDRSNTGSFGETHAEELQQIGTVEAQGSTQHVPSPIPASSPLATESTPASINPAALNNDPAPIPSNSPPVAVTISGPVGTEAKVPTVTPTVAETGVPVSGGPGGPGPSSGSLHDIRASSSGSTQPVSDTENTIVPEGSSSTSPSQQYESAEEEKRRLEREERERLLGGETHASGSKKDEGNADDGEVPPPYQDL